MPVEGTWTSEEKIFSLGAINFGFALTSADEHQGLLLSYLESRTSILFPQARPPSISVRSSRTSHVQSICLHPLRAEMTDILRGSATAQGNVHHVMPQEFVKASRLENPHKNEGCAASTDDRQRTSFPKYVRMGGFGLSMRNPEKFIEGLHLPLDAGSGMSDGKCALNIHGSVQVNQAQATWSRRCQPTI